jgi:hypothetical protein
METVSSLDLESEQGDYASETEFSEMNEDLLYVLDKDYRRIQEEGGHWNYDSEPENENDYGYDYEYEEYY